MARSANSANISRDEGGPDYVSVIGLVRGKLRNNDSDQRSLAQDNSTIYKRIEKEHGVHSGAAKDFAKIDKMAPEKRTDYLRSLLGLLGFAGYDNFDDLVDRAQKPGAKPQSKASGKAPDAMDAATDKAPAERVNLKTGWVQRVKESAADAMALGDADWEDLREATAAEIAAERESQADFDDSDAEGAAAGNIHHFPGSKAN